LQRPLCLFCSLPATSWAFPSVTYYHQKSPFILTLLLRSRVLDQFFDGVDVGSDRGLPGDDRLLILSVVDDEPCCAFSLASRAVDLRVNLCPSLQRRSIRDLADDPGAQHRVPFYGSDLCKVAGRNMRDGGRGSSVSEPAASD